ncbi:MAG: hypothetical protein ACOYYJ_21570 [Chloroflexota bacterium]
MTEEDALWNEYLKGQKYQITEQDGKLGLNFENSVLLEPRYSCVEITNQNVPLSDLWIRKFVVDRYCFVDEWNFPIVYADGKYGLIDGVFNRLVSGLEYDSIVKLTYDHYLCLQSKTYTLKHFIGGQSTVPAAFRGSDKISLPELLNILQAKHPEAYTQLSKTLYFEGNDYISEYWHYHAGICYPEAGYSLYLPIATRKAILSTNFEVTPLELVVLTAQAVEQPAG